MFFSVNGYVLHSFPLEKKGKKVVFFSKEKGIIQFVAQGALNPKSKNFSVCLPFRYFCLTLVQGRNSYRLIGGKTKEIYPGIFQSWKKLLAVRSTASDLEKIAPYGQDKNIFNLLRLTIKEIEKSDESFLRVLIPAFRLKLINLSGYGPDFNSLKGNKKIFTLFLEKSYKELKQINFEEKELLEAGFFIKDFFEITVQNLT
ncbi:DNA repair protein RecO [bacterium]|nr:DNA repair protein RecO [bacterium]